MQNPGINRHTFFITLVIVGSLLYLVSLTFGPRVPQTAIDQGHLWLQNIYLSPHFGISLNLDSYFYLLGAKDTRTVLAHGAILQSRPLLVFIVHPLSKLLEMLPLGSLPGASPLFNELLPTYLAFLLFNLTMLIWSYWLYASIVLPRRNERLEWKYGISTAPTAFVTGTLLVANEITKAFFFAAHTQMLLLLVPLIAFAELLTLSSTLSPRRTYFLHALLVGLTTLAYGGVMVVGAAILLARIFQYFSGKSTGGWRTLADLLLILTMLILPYIGWWGTVTLITGGFYSHEIVRWHQVVWMLEVLDKGWLWLVFALASNLGFLLASALHHLTPVIPLVILLVWFSWPHRVTLKLAIKAEVLFFSGSAVIAVIFLVFFSLVGYRVNRLAIPVMVVLIVVLGRVTAHVEAVLDEPQRRQLFRAAGSVMVIQAVWMVAKEGPFY